MLNIKLEVTAIILCIESIASFHVVGLNAAYIPGLTAINQPHQVQKSSPEFFSQGTYTARIIILWREYRLIQNQ